VTIALATTRLDLRPFRHDDVDDLYAMDGDDRVMRYVGTGLPGRTREQSAQAVVRMAAYSAAHPGYGLLHASRRDDAGFVGGCGLFPLPDTTDIEIGYRLRHDCWGHGYATEMARAVLAHGFGALGLTRIVGVTFPENLPSQRVLVKIGMREAGTAVHYGREMRVFVAGPEVPA